MPTFHEDPQLCDGRGDGSDDGGVEAPAPPMAMPIIVPTDRDVLCGRGMGIRRHPGNVLYNRLLREHLADYRSAPKGSKATLVRDIVVFFREGQPGGTGRFLERTKRRGGSNNNNNNSSSTANNNDEDWVYFDIGYERAILKTAQAFRDIKVTSGKFKYHKSINKLFTESSSPSSSSSPEKNPCGEGDRNNKNKTSKPGSAQEEGIQQHRSGNGNALGNDNGNGNGNIGPPRRPTFRERLAMLERQKQREAGGESCDDSDCDSDCEAVSSGGENDNSGNGSSGSTAEGRIITTAVPGGDAEISDTETEESFPMYGPPRTG